MARNKSRKMTVKYWNSLSKESKKRALTYCFPIHKSIVEMLLNDSPHDVTRRDEWWYDVFSRVRIPEDGCSYKTVIDNHIYLM